MAGIGLPTGFESLRSSRIGRDAVAEYERRMNEYSEIIFQKTAKQEQSRVAAVEAEGRARAEMWGM